MLLGPGRDEVPEQGTQHDYAVRSAYHDRVPSELLSHKLGRGPVTIHCTVKAVLQGHE